MLALAITAVTATLNIPTVKMAGGVELPMLIMGDGASWNRPSNFTSWINLVGKGSGIDTAWDYGQFGGDPPTATKGTSALIPPQIAAAGVKREEVMITTKIPCSGFDGGLEPMNATMAQQYIESNLQMLKTDYVDLLLLHHVCRTPAETLMVWKVMEAAKRAGKARAIGVSNFVVADLQALKSSGITEPISANQCHFTVGQIDNATIDWCRKNNVALESYGTLHGPVDMHHPAITTVAKRRNVSNAAVILKYVSQQGIAIVTASDNTAYDLEDADIFTWQLSAQVTDLALIA
jgi:diketogulonate reductase-like aldo/keto reductase